MTRPSPPDTTTPAPGAAPRYDRQMKDAQFLKTLQATLAGCGNEAAVCSAAVHRVAAAFEAAAACLAAYDPVADTLDILHQARDRRDWEIAILRRAVAEERLVASGEVVAAPIILQSAPHGNGPERRTWGVLALAQAAGNGGDAPPLATPAGRQTLRAAAEHIAAELERRRVYLLDDVIDGLLRKAKPIDVYTHALRQLRRFIRYDHSASVMTMQPGVAQITVRVEKVVGLRGEHESLSDSPRRGQAVRLTAAQARYLNRLEGAVELTDDGGGWHLAGGASAADAAGLWHALCVHEGSGERSILCYPLTFDGQILGLLRVAARRPHAFDPIDQYAPLLDRFARLLSVTLYSSELYHQSDRQLQAIKEIGRAITQPQPVQEICRQVLDLALRVLHVPVGAVGLLTPQNTLELVAHHGSTLARPPTLAVGEGLSGIVVQTGRSRAVPDVTREPAYVVFNGRVRSELIAPISYNREVIGFLDVESFEEERFREEDEEVITFLEALANQAAIAIKAAQLRRDAVERLGTAMAIDPELSMAGLQDLLIDELRHKIEQLAAANEQLVAASRAKSEFLAHMSHDLRGPLNVIVGLSNLLTDPAVAPTLDREKQRESLELIRSNGEVLGALIGNILDLASVESGKVQLDATSFNAAATFTYLRAVAQTLVLESGKEIDVRVAVDPAIAEIHADEEKFLRIMHNLISNAVKFTPSGGRVALTAAAGETAGAEAGQTRPRDRAAGPARRPLHVTVSDTGVGIAPEHHERVFGAFQQIEPQLSRQYHGTGLGLTVVRQFVELHGGRVWLDSAPGAGSSFHVSLPDAAVLDEARAEPDGDVQPAGDTPMPVPYTAPLTILVVEDIPAHMNVMRLAVTAHGHTMHGAASGEEALEWLADHRPDVILLDMQLAGIDGFAVAEQVKGRVETHAIPIIAVTADALSVTEERALASGCDAYLTKPIDMDTLLATIERLTNRPRAHAAPGRDNG